MAKMTLKIKVSNPHFQYQLLKLQDACLVQIWCFQLKYVTNYSGQSEIYGRTSRRTDGRTDAGNGNTPGMG